MFAAVRGSLRQSGRRDSNSGPHRPERCALPGCATPRRAPVSHTRLAARSPHSVSSLVPAATSEILAELDRLLEPERFEDYCVNGLQVPGPAQVQTIATGVSAHAELFELAARERAQLLLVHHGLFWGSGVRAIDAAAEAPPAAAVRRGHRARRLPPAAGRASAARQQRAARARARRADELDAVRAAPRPADRLPRELPRRRHAPRGAVRARARGHRARAARVRRGAGARAAPRDRLRRGRRLHREAAAAGADALLTGEPAERSMAQARESGVHLIAAGPLRDRDVRRQASRRASRRALRAAPRLPRRAQPRVSRLRPAHRAPGSHARARSAVRLL